MNTNILKAGIVASLGIWSKDSYDNTIDARNTSIEFVFKVLHMDALTMGSRINLNISIVPEKTKGYWSITMRPSLIGKFLLEVAWVSPRSYCMPKYRARFIIATNEGQKID